MQRGYTGSRQNVAVIGGGISGLVSAYRLLQQGYGVTVFEADAELGGLGGTFEHEGRQLEKFYHVMLPSDGDLLGLLEELGMSRQVIWRETSMGFLHQKQVYPFNTALDLLRSGAVADGAGCRVCIQSGTGPGGAGRDQCGGMAGAHFRDGSVSAVVAAAIARQVW
jgi:protoporphyrinogen oxidase